MKRTVIMMSLVGTLGLLAGCESTEQVAVNQPVLTGAPIELAAGDALGRELMTVYVASVESELYYASESTD